MVGAQNLHNTFGRPHRDRTLFDHDFATLRNVGNHAGGVFDELQVGRASASVAEGFRRCVDRNENQFGLFDGRLDVGGEEQVDVATLLDDGIESGLMVGK